MSRARIPVALILLAGGLCVAPGSSSAAVRGPRAAPSPARRTQAVPASIPLHFEENVGQAPEEFRFLARGHRYTAYLAPHETAFALPAGETGWDVVRMRFAGASSHARLRGGAPLAGRSHYLRGDDPSAWLRDVQHLGRVDGVGLYPGIDVRWRSGAGRTLAYDLVVAPGADPAAISVAFEGATGADIAPGGALVLATPHGELRHSAPHVYQERAGRRRTVRGRFALRAEGRVGFEVGTYDRSLPLVIDPDISYSTYMGGSNIIETSYDVAVDGAGAAYVVGFTRGTDFPTQSPLQSSNAGDRDAFVFKVNAAGDALVYSTYLGGSKQDIGEGIAVDASGNAYVGGDTISTDFPTQSALQGSHGGGTYDCFLAKLNASGSALVYSTYHGGSGDDGTLPGCIAVDGTGAVWMVCDTLSTDFPTSNAIYATKQAPGNTSEMAVTKFDAAGSALSFSTYYSGPGSGSVGDATHHAGVAVDGNGAAYITGQAGTGFPTKSPIQSTAGGSGDAFVLKLNSSGTVVYATYLGGSGSDDPQAIAVGADGAAYVVGVTTSTDFPTVSPYQATNAGGVRDLFVTKVDPGGTAWAYSTYLGGSGDDRWRASSGAEGGIAVDANGLAYVTGGTRSSDFPTASPLTGGGSLSGAVDGFVAVLGTGGDKLVYSTYLGGSSDFDAGFQVALDKSSNVYVVGRSSSSDYPLKNPIQGSLSGPHDSVLTKIGSPAPPPGPTGLTVTGSSATQVDLEWTDAGEGETKFELERKTGGGAFAEIAEPAADATTYTDTTVAADTAYTYRIRAVNDNGASEWSNEASVVTIDSPDQLVADVVSNVRIDLEWRDRSGSEDGFEVARRQAGAEEFTTLDTVVAGVSSLADAAVQPETTYSYRVRATKGGGASGWSNVEEVTTPPADPSDVVPSNYVDAEVRITWRDLSGAETGYEVERGIGCPPAVYTLLVTVGPNVTEYIDRTALPETVYSYRVRAVSAAGHSEYTAPVCLTTAPNGPSGFTAAAGSPSRIRLAWADNSTVEDGFEVQRTVAGRDEWEEIADLPADATEYTDAGVSPEAAFDYRVRAYDDNGRSRNATAEDVSTPAALVVRSAKLLIPTGRAARRRKPTLVARGEVDVGGADVDLEGAATLWIGDTQVAIPGFTSLRRGRVLRFDEDGVRLDLKPSRLGASRVPFTLRVVGDVAAALDRDEELFLRFRSGEFDAMGVVTLAAGVFNPARGRGTWIDPPLNLLSVVATPKRRSFQMRATFPPGDLPATAPEVTVLLDIFEISFEPGAFKKRGRTKYVLARRLGPVRQKVVLDYRRGTLSIVLRGVALQTYEPGTVLVPLAVAIGTTRLEDRPMLVVTRRSFRY